jgi:glucosamine-6-phosphate deaminase
MKRNFYAKLDAKLRPPEKQIQGPTNKNWKDYSKMLADLGGADVCYGGIGWSGHLAFIEPGSTAFAAKNWDEWCKLDARFVEITPITLLQNCLGPEFGQSGDWSWAPPRAFTIGPKEILSAKLRSSWNGFRVGNSMVSWQRFIIRLAAHGPVNMMIPSTLLQTVPSELHMVESLAEDITPVSVEQFNWYA